MEITEGLTHICSLTVGAGDTALAIGSGDMAVLATPRMLALMEQAALLAVKDALPTGQTSVGGYIASSHLRPSPPGAVITATATLTKVDGCKLHFHVRASMGDVLIGEGDHLRFIVDREKFLSRL